MARSLAAAGPAAAQRPAESAPASPPGRRSGGGGAGGNGPVAALRDACVQGDTKRAAELLAGRGLPASLAVDTALDSDRNTPLHYAANYGHEALAALLLAAGADVNSRTLYQQTPLMLCESAAVAHTLLRHGADAAARSLKGLDASSCAKRNGRPQVVEAIERAARRSRMVSAAGGRPRPGRVDSGGSASSSSGAYRPGDADDDSDSPKEAAAAEWRGLEGRLRRRRQSGPEVSALDLARAELRQTESELLQTQRELVRERIHARERRAEAEREAGALRQQNAALELDRLRLNQQCAAQERELRRLHQLVQQQQPAAPAGPAAASPTLAAGDPGETVQFPHTRLLAQLPVETLQDLERRAGAYHAAAREALADTTRCVVCHEGDQSVILLPCKHQVLCSGCADKVTKCPMCRANIAECFTPFKS